MDARRRNAGILAAYVGPDRVELLVRDAQDGHGSSHSMTLADRAASARTQIPFPYSDYSQYSEFTHQGSSAMSNVSDQTTRLRLLFGLTGLLSQFD
jgi:hypothetical protein